MNVSLLLCTWRPQYLGAALITYPSLIILVDTKPHSPTRRFGIWGYQHKHRCRRLNVTPSSAPLRHGDASGSMGELPGYLCVR
ncbi:hypothetical protein LY76DRAFT_355441 [Colletotrichum caudatum]|nr:hypothetical protein LY76DRAFT_355441 [Colletotrichum caudatum]